MCLFGLHWWRHIPDGWGMRKCRVCQRKEQAYYHALTGLYWIRL